MAVENIILGIDPGTTVMGFGLIRVNGDNIELISLEELHLQKLPSHQLKLKRIFEKTLSLIQHYKPTELAIEAPFFGINPQSILKLGRAQGVAIAAGLYSGIPIIEYSPRKIKAAITGRGGASKEQVAKTLQHMLGIKELPKKLDSTDGLAVAVCHCFQSKKNYVSQERGYSSWEAFVKNNTDRLA
ncbi:crossover junction endodeoxyribonuclease RuvC [Ichthyobacterium seriolicida]|uniref:Crossover junction endodeoxyribonuclease RuvC n=1 Tax=Ichthyobacterium seriolicida TaxID=242600 RepID=A0A1J1DXB5_9FLAO|nr:crossover junction endodeoxyribonuclease RuvC [Ichthyobacterium seriolicida]BAV94495.1 crossover junction endodeoxyribonuclease RuvC [Ichthyobacterium seriolicida]